jgi:hypothetical protein
MEERDRSCEDDDGGRRGTFTTGLRRRGGCANPSQTGVSRERDAAEDENEKRGLGWWSSPVPAKTTRKAADEAEGLRTRPASRCGGGGGGGSCEGRELRRRTVEP